MSDEICELSLKYGQSFISRFSAASGTEEQKNVIGRFSKCFTVDPVMFADDEAAGVLKNGSYVKNPTAKNITEYISETSNYLGSKQMNGQYMYVIDMDNNIIIGTRSGQRMPHPTLVGGYNPCVQAAGIVEIRGGNI